VPGNSPSNSTPRLAHQLHSHARPASMKRSRETRANDCPISRKKIGARVATTSKIEPKDAIARVQILITKSLHDAKGLSEAIRVSVQEVTTNAVNSR